MTIDLGQLPSSPPRPSRLPPQLVWAPPLRGLWLALFLSLAAIAVLPPTATAGPAPVSTGHDKLAVSGYDPVAYFVAGKPMKGTAELSAVHAGATWRFASDANRAAFLAEPAKFMPQYGGYCAWAVSQGYTAASDPNVWKIVDGKLYLNYNRSVGRNWEANAFDNIHRANSNWPKMLAK